MLEPIDIDINMNQNISEEGQRASQANEEMTRTANAAMKEIERLEKIVQDMSIALAQQEKIIESSNADFGEASMRISTMREALAQAESQLETYRTASEQASSAIREGADVTDVLAEVTTNLAEVEASLVDNAQEIIDNQSEINDVIDEGSENTDTYSASNQLASEALKRVAVALGIENAQLIRSTTNVHMITAAKRIWAGVLKVLTVQLGMSTLAAKALLLTGVGALVAGVAFAIYAFKDWNKNTQDLSQSLEEFNKSAASGASKQRVAFEKLRQEWVSAGKELEAKEKLVQKNIKAYNDFGIEVNNVNDAESIFVDNADKIVESINKRAMAVAAMELASEKYKESLQATLDAEEEKANPTSWTKYKAMMIGFFKGEDRKDVLDNMIEDRVDDLTTKAERANRAAKNAIMVAMGIDKETTKDIEKGSKEFYQQIADYNQQLLDNMTSDQVKSSSGRKAIQARDNALKMLGLWSTNKNSKKNSNSPEEKATTTLEKKVYDYQKRIDAARVAGIRDGAEKERQALKAEYTQTQAFIEKELKELDALEKKTGKPADDQRKGLLLLDVEATKFYENELSRINANSKKTLDNLFAEVNARFSSELDNNLLEIKRYYEEVISDAKKADENVDITPFLKAKDKDEDRARTINKLRKLDLDEALEMEKANNLASIGLTTIAEQTKYEIAKRYLQDRIKLLREIGDEASNKEADILEARLKGLNTAKAPSNIANLVNGKIFNVLQKGFEKTGMSAEDAKEKSAEVFSGIQKGGATASAVINEVKGMFGGLNEELDIALDSLGSIAEGFATGGIAGGVMATIGQGVKMFTHAAQVEKEHQEALRQLALAKLEMQREYNLLLLKEQLLYKQGSNIFGVDQIRGAKNAIETYRETILQLKKEMQGDWTPDEELEKRLEKLSSSKSPFASYFQKKLDSYKTQLNAYNQGMAALADVDIVTGSRKSGWGFWKKRKDVYSNLLETYDDVIDAEGKLNTARIESILATHKMSDENRALLESLLKLEEAAKEAEEQLTDYLTQTFGSLGDALADSIVTAFRTGEDAAELFKGNVTDVLNDLAKQMVFGLYLKESFDKVEKDIKKSYEDLADDKLTEQELSHKITDILGGFFGGLDGDIEKANKFLEEFWKNAEANGFDRPEGERQGAKGGFANASQDSINELTGGVYAVRQIVGDIRNDNRELLLIERTMQQALNTLVENSEYLLFLDVLPQMQTVLENIESYGIKMKG